MERRISLHYSYTHLLQSAAWFFTVSHTVEWFFD
jgi:hypothetical protein